MWVAFSHMGFTCCCCFACKGMYVGSHSYTETDGINTASAVMSVLPFTSRTRRAQLLHICSYCKSCRFLIWQPLQQYPKESLHRPPAPHLMHHLRRLKAPLPFCLKSVSQGRRCLQTATRLMPAQPLQVHRSTNLYV